MLFGDRAGQAALDEVVGPRYVPGQGARIAAQFSFSSILWPSDGGLARRDCGNEWGNGWRRRQCSHSEAEITLAAWLRHARNRLGAAVALHRIQGAGCRFRRQGGEALTQLTKAPCSY